MKWPKDVPDQGYAPLDSFVEWELNPKARSDISDKRLSETMNRWGALYPVAVVPVSVGGRFKMQVVDGHRRLRTAMALSIPLLGYWRFRATHLVTGQLIPIEGEDIKIAILDANLAVDKWTQKAQAQFAQKAPGTMEHLGDKTRRVIAQAQTMMGAKKYDEALQEKDFSLSSVDVAAAMAKHLKKPNSQFAMTCLRWIRRHHMTSVIKNAIRMNVPARDLERALRYDEPFTFKG